MGKLYSGAQAGKLAGGVADDARQRFVRNIKRIAGGDFLRRR
jgi:hypothetical protein